eukprot:COSAG01_NODE_2064_length_8507_cov_312.247740_2_plen_215_part_00
MRDVQQPRSRSGGVEQAGVERGLLVVRRRASVVLVIPKARAPFFCRVEAREVGTGEGYPPVRQRLYRGAVGRVACRFVEAPVGSEDQLAGLPHPAAGAQEALGRIGPEGICPGRSVKSVFAKECDGYLPRHLYRDDPLPVVARTVLPRRQHRPVAGAGYVTEHVAAVALVARPPRRPEAADQHPRIVARIVALRATAHRNRHVHGPLCLLSSLR